MSDQLFQLYTHSIKASISVVNVRKNDPDQKFKKMCIKIVFPCDLFIYYFISFFFAANFKNTKKKKHKPERKQNLLIFFFAFNIISNLNYLIKTNINSYQIVTPCSQGRPPIQITWLNNCQNKIIRAPPPTYRTSFVIIWDKRLGGLFAR